ncbi:MAG TPA: hypothetical protein ENN03_10645 [bacterium]|nr:hypothetical protein [bacterium]
MEKMSDPIITATILYDLVHCPHRIYLDQYGDETDRDPESAFLRLLWERGALHEREVMSGMEAEYTDIIIKKTEWPVNDRSIKSLAPVLGFKWRDENPSGAESIEWYDEWVRTGNPDAKKRILLYNEDDCVATRVVLDGVKQLEVKQF